MEYRVVQNRGNETTLNLIVYISYLCVSLLYLELTEVYSARKPDLPWVNAFQKYYFNIYYCQPLAGNQYRNTIPEAFTISATVTTPSTKYRFVILSTVCRTDYIIFP